MTRHPFRALRCPALAALLLGALGADTVVAGEIDLKSLQPIEATKKKKQDGAYVGVFVGQTTSQSSSMKIDYADHGLDYDVADRDGDLIVGIEVGYSWRTRFPIELGLEFEALFGSTEIDGIVGVNDGVPISLSDVATTKTDLSYAAFMLNGTLTLDLRKYRPRLGPIIPRFRPYIGAGFGGAQIWYRNQMTQTFGDLLGTPTAASASPFNIDEFVLATQIFAGLEYKVNDKFGFYGEVRRLTFEQTNELKDLKTNIMIGGLRLHY